MPQISHQTVRLSRGRHPSPIHGACVMELASMLAGEEFSDHASCVSPAIGSLLRAYNDLLDDVRRQDLRAVAAQIVGTRHSEQIERIRVQRLLEWGDERWAGRCQRSLLARLQRHTRGRRPPAGLAEPATAARYALEAAGRIGDETHHAVLGLIAELVDVAPPAISGRPPRPTPARAA